MIRQLLSGRVSLVLSAAILVLISLIIAVAISTGRLEKKNDSLKTQMESIRTLSEAVFQVKRIVDAKEKKIGLTDASGAVSVMEQVLRELGLMARVLKPSEKRPVTGYIEEDVELEIAELDLNSIVNLLYRLENSAQPIKIKNAFMKTSFEDQDKFILKLTASLISKE